MIEEYEIRRAGPEDSAALFVVHAALIATDAGQLLDWTQEFEARLETGARAWVAARGRRLAGYAFIDLIPGLPGVYDLSGGVVPARRRHGLGTRLLQNVRDGAGSGVRQLSCRVESLEDEAALFLLGRSFFVEHEECLLELTDLGRLPPIPTEPPGELINFPAEQAAAEFLRIYDESFTGLPWSQPYSVAEVAETLRRPEDLLFYVVDARPIGVVWHEMLSDGRGRVEPLGIARDYHGQGHGRRLLLAALHRLQGEGAEVIEIGLWRQNAIAMNLYKGLGFLEVANWYYLACDLEGLKAA